MNLAACALGKFNSTFAQREQGVVLAATDVLAGMEVRTTLANDDVAGDNMLAAETLHAKSLCVRIAAITSGT